MSKDRTFKIQITIRSSGDIHEEEIKDALYRKIQGLTIENEEGKDIEFETVDYWVTAKVTEV